MEDGGIAHRVAREGLNDKVTFNSRRGINLSQTLQSISSQLQNGPRNMELHYPFISNVKWKK